MDKYANIQELRDEIQYLLSLIDKMESAELKQVDVGVLRSKVAGIYERIINLNTKNDIVQEKKESKEEVETELKIEETISKEIKFEEDNNVTNESQPDEEKELKINFDNPIEEDETAEFKPSVELIKEKSEETKTHRTIGEKFGNKKTIHDLVKEVEKEDVNYKYLKVDNLIKAISINDKIEFIRELFENDSEKYSTTLKILNEQNDLDSAIFVLSELDFDNEKPAAKKLINLVYRKFLDE